MTEDQKAISLILDLLNATRQVPRTLDWIQTEVKLAGRKVEVPAILETMVDAGFLETARDAMKIRRYTITAAGRAALNDL